jgi:hypothetical protein
MLAMTLLGVFAFEVVPVRATVIREVPLESLAHEADAIVLGVVEHVGVRMDMTDARGEPLTISTIRVHDWVKGNGGDLVRVSEIGGVLPHGGFTIAGTPRYHVREEVVVFLRRVGSEYRTYAMEQGHFTIRRGVPGVPDTVERDLSALGIASFGHGTMQVDHGERASMRLDDFLSYVRATLEQVRTDGDNAGDPLGGAR